MPSTVRLDQHLTVTFHYQWIHLWRGAREYLGNPSHVVWLYDEQTHRIGLRSSPAVEGACRLTKSGMLATTAFFRQHGIVVPLGAISHGEPEEDALMFGLPHGPDAVYRML